VVIDLPSVDWKALKGEERIQFFPGDISNIEDVKEASRDVDVVIHLAALLPPNSESNKILTKKVNVEGTRNIVEAIKSRNEIPLIFASSISTYGVTSSEGPPVNEDRPQRAHDVYSESKIEAERIIRASEIPYVVLRIAPIAIADLVELPDIVPYKADQRVEFICVEDAARALFSAAVNKNALGRILNIAGGASWQMTGAKYIERFYEALGVEVEPNFNEEYTAIDWYDTSRSAILGYQRVTFDKFLEKLQRVATELGLV
jgi:nucleoside-diphosphate-sugar epimerase